MMAVIIFFPLELAFGIFQKLSTALTSLFFSGDFDVEFEKVEKVELISLNTMFKDDFNNKSFKIDFCKAYFFNIFFF